MKKLVFATTLLLASVSQADVIRCTFTEPFVNSTYSMTKSELTFSGANGSGKIKNVSFQIKDAGSFELVSKDGKVLQTLTLTNNGTDGSSDAVYPFEVKDSSKVTGDHSAVGVCVSNHLKSKE